MAHEKTEHSNACHFTTVMTVRDSLWVLKALDFSSVRG